MYHPTIERDYADGKTEFSELEVGEFFLYDDALWIVTEFKVSDGKAYCLDEDSLDQFSSNDMVERVKVHIRYSRAD